VNLYPNPRQELIALFRGFISVPVIAELDKLGLIEVLMRESFKAEAAFAEAGYSIDFFIGVDPINNNMFSAGTYGLSPIHV
jgi:hypothetical protein